MVWAGAKRKSDGGKGKDGNSKRPSTVEKKTKKPLVEGGGETVMKKRKEVSEKSEKAETEAQQPAKKAKVDPQDEGNAMQRKDAVPA
eukprot:1553579-Rhodomonas_salina.3